MIAHPLLRTFFILLPVGALSWVSGASITVTAPNGYESWNPGGLPAVLPVVTWSSSGVTNVKIDLYKGGAFLKTMAASVPASSGTYSGYSITNTHPVGGDFRVRVSSVENPSDFDESNIDFVIRSSSSDCSLVVTATVGSSAITLRWSKYSAGANTYYEIFRRPMSSAGGGWGTSVAGGSVFSGSAWVPVPGGLGVADTSWTDTTVVPGVIYEYKVVRNGYSEGFVCAGIDLPLTENRGTVILLVDDTMAGPLAAELLQMKRDLVGDGWKVIQHNVGRKSVGDTGWKEAVVATKALIVADYQADPNVKAVYIIGHVPIPYSGNINPDGHTEHKGAWPADLFYGDLNGTWTDTSVNNSSTSLGADFLAQRNLPGDGKFDQSVIPTPVSLAVGRVDLQGMTAFSLSETELLRQYLNKNHNFRHGILDTQPRVVIDENFNEAFGNSGYLFGGLTGGDATIDRADYLTTLRSDGSNNSGKPAYLFAFGHGGGGITQASGVATTWDIASTNPRAIFTGLFGSYFGDWDHANGFLRAPLATGAGLTSFWGGRPHWTFHAMAMGQTTGYSTLTSQNADSTYGLNSYGQRMVHVALMGDPTLRLHVVPAVTSLVGATIGGVTNLYWAASADPAVLGYHVYRATDELGPFTRLTGVTADAAHPDGSPITATSFTDSTRVPGTTYKYMVRAVKNETGYTAGGGNYFNLSQGVLADEGSNTGSWDGGAGDNAWSSPANWASDIALTAGKTIDFGGTTNLAPGNDFPVGTTFAGITFDPTAGSFNLTGNSITLAGGVTNLSAASQTISLGLSLSGDCVFSTAAGDMTVNGPVSSTGGLVKAGAGTLTVAGTNTYTGRTAVSGGTLKLVSAIPTSAPLQMSGDGILDLNGNNVTFTTSSALGGNTGAGTNTITDNGAGAGTSVVFFKDPANKANNDQAALIKDGATRKVTVKISNANDYKGLLANPNSTYSGGTTLTAADSAGTRYAVGYYTPTLSGGNLTKSEYGTAAIYVGANATDKATLLIDAPNKAIYNDIVWNGTGTTENRGQLVLNKANTTTFHGTQTLNVDLKMSAFGQGAAALIIAGKVTGNGGLTLAAPAAGFAVTLTLQNAAGTNDFAGLTNINRVNETLLLGANNQIPDGTGKGNVNVVGALRMSGFSDTINGLTGNGTVDNSSATTASTLTLGGNNTTASFTGTITNGGNATLGIIKTGSGTQTLAGTNTYTGNTAVVGGILKLAGAIPASAALQMSGTGILDLNGNSATFTTSTALGSNTATLGTTITDNGAGSGTSVVYFNDNANKSNKDMGALIADGATRKVGVKITNGQYWNSMLTNANSTYSGGTLVAHSAAGSRLAITDYTPSLVGPTLTKSQYGTGVIIIGEAATDKASIYFDTGFTGTFHNGITFNTPTGLDANWKGVAINVAGVTLAGTQTANLADAIYETFTPAGRSATITGRITGSKGLSVGPVAYAMNLTLANAAGTNDYAGDTKIGQVGRVILGANDQLPDGAGKGNVDVTASGANIGYLSLNGYSDTINGLTGNGTVRNNSATTASTLTLGGNNTTASFTGTITNGATASLGITKTGSGTQTLNGTNTYTGDTTVSQGTLTLAGSSRIADASAVRLSSGTTLRLDHGAADTVGSLFIDGVQKWNGIWGPVGSAARYQTSLLTGNGTLTVAGGPAPSFDGWAWENGLAARPPLDATMTADPDADSIPNLLEWILGGNPLMADSASRLPALGHEGTDIVFTFRRSRDTLGKVALEVGYGTDLAAWTTIAAGAASSGPDANGVRVVVTDLGGGTDEILVIIPESLGSGGSLFARLVATFGG